MIIGARASLLWTIGHQLPEAPPPPKLPPPKLLLEELDELELSHDELDELLPAEDEFDNSGMSLEGTTSSPKPIIGLTRSARNASNNPSIPAQTYPTTSATVSL